MASTTAKASEEQKQEAQTAIEQVKEPTNDPVDTRPNPAPTMFAPVTELMPTPSAPAPEPVITKNKIARDKEIPEEALAVMSSADLRALAQGRGYTDVVAIGQQGAFAQFKAAQSKDQQIKG